MIDPVLARILMTAFAYGACGALVASVVRLINRDKSGPTLDQTAAIGFLVGAGFGAFIGIFQSMMIRT